MPGYTKFFDAMLDSTVWDEDDGTRLLWVTMLLMVNRDGVVEASVPGLAKRARISLEKAEAGLTRLLAPDKYSRTPDNDGRRIEAITGGWRILNYDLYRWKSLPTTAADRAHHYRERKKKALASLNVTVHHDNVTKRASRPNGEERHDSVTDHDERVTESRNASSNCTSSSIGNCDSLPKVSSIPLQTPRPKRKNGVVFAGGVIQQLAIPTSPMLVRMIGEAIDYRVQQTGNPEKTEADFIIRQYREWETSPSGQHSPRLSPLSWFQGKHYNDDPKSWRSNEQPNQLDLIRNSRTKPSVR